ncbi:ABC transporter permease subunit, partial [Microcoleus sp. PH2017_02_FOX_O_A]
DGQSCAVLGLGLSLAAFVADIIRGGINSIPPGEIEVAYCTGMTRLETIRYILIPQVFRKSWLPLMGQYITTYKFSTLASVIAVPEILHTANSIIAQTYRPIEIYSTVAAMFIATVVPLNLLLRRVQQVKELGGTETI